MSLYSFHRSGFGWRLAVLASALVLAGCGFRLQGSGGYPESMASTYIDTQDRYTVFYRKLSESLRSGGVTLTDSVVDADAVIRIENDSTGQKILTVSIRNVPTEYDVYYSVNYSVWMNGKEVLPSHGITMTQDYTFDETEELGMRRQEQIIREAIAGEVVRRVSQELSRL